jgi:hypothetical protein
MFDMNILSAEQNRTVMLLHQLGAKVKTVHGIICYVRFEVAGSEVLYVYNINAKDQYFLQRLRPYPLGAGVFSSQREIINFIVEDLAQLQNASKSSIYENFIDVNNRLHKMIHMMESSF